MGRCEEDWVIPLLWRNQICQFEGRGWITKLGVRTRPELTCIAAVTARTGVNTITIDVTRAMPTYTDSGSTLLSCTSAPKRNRDTVRVSPLVEKLQDTVLKSEPF